MSAAAATLQRQQRRAQVLSADALAGRIGPPPAKRNSNYVCGSILTPAYIAKARASGIDYLLYLELIDNATERSSNQARRTKTVTDTTCSKTKTKDSYGRRNTTRTEVYFSSSATASRSLTASYTLLSTATGHPVWQACSRYAAGETASKTAPYDFPLPPAPPLPPMEAALMQRMTVAALRTLP